MKTLDPGLERALPRSLPGSFIAVCVALLLVGILAFVLGVGADAGRTWGILLVNIFFFLGIAQGGVVIAAILKTTRGNWGRGIARIAESLGAFLPAGFVLVAFLLFAGARHLYPWIEEPDPRRHAWLNLPGMAARDLVALAVLLVMSLRFVQVSLAPDLLLVRDRVPDRLRGLYDRVTGRVGDVEGALARERRVHRSLAPLVILVWTLVFSLLAFDLLMSLEPEWASSLFGAYIFMGGLYTAWATVWVFAPVVRGQRALGAFIAPKHFHDLGKFTFSWALAWLYLFWSQFLPIWYGNMHEETGYVIHRVHGLWAPLAWTVLVMCFLIPFLGLLPKKPKIWLPAQLVIGAVILSGMFLEKFLLVMPSPAVSPQAMTFGLTDAGVTLGVLALFLLSVGWFHASFPIVPLADAPPRHAHPEEEIPAVPTPAHA